MTFPVSGAAAQTLGFLAGLTYAATPVAAALLLRSEGEGDLNVTSGAALGALCFLGLLFALGSAVVIPVLVTPSLRWVLWISMVAGSIYLISFSFVLWPVLLFGLGAPGLFGRRR